MRLFECNFLNDHLQVNHLRNTHHIIVHGDNPPDPIESFEQLTQEHAVPQQVVNNLIACGYKEPTPIQRQAITMMANVSSSRAQYLLAKWLEETQQMVQGALRNNYYVIHKLVIVHMLRCRASHYWHVHQRAVAKRPLSSCQSYAILRSRNETGSAP